MPLEDSIDAAGSCIRHPFGNPTWLSKPVGLEAAFLELELRDASIRGGGKRNHVPFGLSGLGGLEVVHPLCGPGIVQGPRRRVVHPTFLPCRAVEPGPRGIQSPRFDLATKPGLAFILGTEPLQ